MSSELPKNSQEYRDASVRAIRRMIKTVIENRELVTIFIKEAVSVDRELERKIYEFQMKFAQLASIIWITLSKRGLPAGAIQTSSRNQLLDSVSLF